MVVEEVAAADYGDCHTWQVRVKILEARSYFGTTPSTAIPNMVNIAAADCAVHGR